MLGAMSRRLVALVLLALTLPLGRSARAKPVRAELEQLLAETDVIAEKVARLRGLKIKKPIVRAIVSRQEVTRKVLERIDEEYDAAELAAEALAYKRLGLLAADADYQKTVVDLLTEQIAGFYDPHAGKLYIADWIEPAMQRMVMAHEIGHALQDQSFGLVSFIEPLKDNSDEQLARQAVTEGDGLAIMIEFMLLEMGLEQSPWTQPGLVESMRGPIESDMDKELAAAPLFLRESLLFPYLGGIGLVADVLRHHPWARVDDLYRQPPVSTEQVLHPEKYFAGEKPRPIRTADLPAFKGWPVLYRNVVGELMWSVIFRQHGVARQQATAAAAGWAGDRLVTVAPPAEERSVADVVVVDLSVWDTEVDAIEAFEAVEDGLGGWCGGAAGAPAAGKKGLARCQDASGDVTLVERRGDQMLLVIGAPAELSERIRGEVWKKWKVARR